MMGFIINVIIFTIGVGWFFGYMAVGGIPERHEWQKKIIVVITALMIGIIITILLYFNHNYEQKIWNNGCCPNCQTEWQLVNVEHVRNTGNTYYYTCPKCGKIIEQNYN